MLMCGSEVGDGRARMKSGNVIVQGDDGGSIEPREKVEQSVASL